MQIRLWTNSSSSFGKIPREKCEIKHAAHCDHYLVTMELQINVRGPGFWKFNFSLLEDDECTEIN